MHIGNCFESSRRVSPKTEKGSVYVEACFALPAFLILILIGLDTVRVAFVVASFQFGVLEGARYASIACHDPSCKGELANVIKNKAQMQDLDVSDIEFCDETGACTQNLVGQEHAIMALRVVRPVSFVMLGGKTINVTKYGVYRNEPEFET